MRCETTQKVTLTRSILETKMAEDIMILAGQPIASMDVQGFQNSR